MNTIQIGSLSFEKDTVIPEASPVLVSRDWTFNLSRGVIHGDYADWPQCRRVTLSDIEELARDEPYHDLVMALRA